jgi:NADH:ubiquinone oxidoreductase subunit 4 (subunit M)
MHNRVGQGVDSHEMSWRDSAVLVPLVLVIVFMAIYPQLALERSEGSTKAAVTSAQADLKPTIQTSASTFP